MCHKITFIVCINTEITGLLDKIMKNSLPFLSMFSVNHIIYWLSCMILAFHICTSFIPDSRNISTVHFPIILQLLDILLFFSSCKKSRINITKKLLYLLLSQVSSCIFLMLSDQLCCHLGLISGLGFFFQQIDVIQLTEKLFLSFSSDISICIMDSVEIMK